MHCVELLLAIREYLPITLKDVTTPPPKQSKSTKVDIQSYLQWSGWSGKFKMIKQKPLHHLLTKCKIAKAYSDWLYGHGRFAQKVKLCLKRPLKMVKTKKRQKGSSDEEYDLKPSNLVNIDSRSNKFLPFGYTLWNIDKESPAQRNVTLQAMWAWILQQLLSTAASTSQPDPRDILDKLTPCFTRILKSWWDSKSVQ